MRIRASRKEIRKAYSLMKEQALAEFAKGNVGKSMTWIQRCTVLAQQYNWIYADDELEGLMQGIGERLIPGPDEDFQPVSGRIVFYDDFCTSFVLALQYLRALVAAGNEVLYVTVKHEDDKNRFSTIIPEVSTYPNVKVVCLPKEKRTEIIRNLYAETVAFRPQKILLHIKAFSNALPAIYRLPKRIEKYIINLADQTFWLGRDAIDYSLEFRPFGASVSMDRRGLKKEQLLMVPFYPVPDNNPFGGFPPECTEDKVVVFSGGDLYKVVDERNTYWRLVKGILDRYPQVVFLFATKISKGGTRMIERFIKKNRFQGRFIYVHFRKDITEVFKHCDIYMGTCPASGSLMSQLAATHAKPILQFYYPETADDETEQAICFNENFPISFRDEASFMKEADRLIRDARYRQSQGSRLKQSMIRVDQFNQIVLSTLATNKTQVPIPDWTVDYASLDDRWYDLEKCGYTDALSYIWGVLDSIGHGKDIPSLSFKRFLRRIVRIVK